MRVTVDINVLLDVFQKREPHYAASARVLAMVQQGEVDGVFPAHGFTTLYYLVRKHASRPDAEAAMDDVLRHFEDAVVAVVAEQTASEMIITRNTGDFGHSPVPAITPVEFLSQFAPL